MEWVEILPDNSNLPLAGRWVVKTTKLHYAPKMASIGIQIESVIHTSLSFVKREGKSDLPVWDCNNQKVTHYLKD